MDSVVKPNHVCVAQAQQPFDCGSDQQAVHMAGLTSAFPSGTGAVLLPVLNNSQSSGLGKTLHNLTCSPAVTCCGKHTLRRSSILRAVARFAAACADICRHVFADTRKLLLAGTSDGGQGLYASPAGHHVQGAGEEGQEVATLAQQQAQQQQSSSLSFLNTDGLQAGIPALEAQACAR
jgi:hypothetical protein